jgi:pyruvate,orthophosphate dikinase
MLADLLGGKGAGLAYMTTRLDLPVPPGFTITTEAARVAAKDGRLAPDLRAQIRHHLDRLGEQVRDESGRPLLVSVRSGAPVSMPGMLDTVLNVGLDEATVPALAAATGDEAFAWDCYLRFLRSWTSTVLGLPADQVGENSADAPAAHRANEIRERVEQVGGAAIPDTLAQQVEAAVEAVLCSWHSPRARAYRAKEGIAEDLGTAVNVQAMVFGNRDRRSGTGVAFSRNPTSGAGEPYGDFLAKAQGEDVVDGSQHPLPLAEMAPQFSTQHAQLGAILRRLEVTQRDLVEVEFTIEHDKLWILQYRVGKRSAAAAVRIAVDLVDDPEIRLSRSEALARVSERDLELARPNAVADTDAPLLGRGIGVTPGVAVGRAYFDAQRCADAVDRGEEVILVRPETAPEDVQGMALASGLLTSRGGRVSHAALIARAWGKVAICGVEDLAIAADHLRTSCGVFVAEGDLITLDGETGSVYVGAVQVREADVPQELATILAWRENNPTETCRA